MTQRKKIALAQIRPALGDVAVNLDKHLRFIEEARQSGAEVVVFPELGLTGYQVQDMTLEVARTLHHQDILSLVRASVDIDVVFSFVEESPSHQFYISAIYASVGEIVHVHRKVYLPTYGMFDEGRYFGHGESFATFARNDRERAGLFICEDAWHVSSPNLLVLDGATILYLPASSPARSVTEANGFGSERFWTELLEVYATLFATPIVFVNRVGFEDGVNFFGASGVVSSEGEWVIRAPRFEEGLYYGHLDMRRTRVARFTTPMLRDEQPRLVQREIARILAQRDAGMKREWSSK